MKPASYCPILIPFLDGLPRRLMFVAALFSLGVIVRPTGVSADESLDAFLARYQKAIEPVRAAYRHCSYEGSREMHIPGESENSRRPKTFRVFAKGDRMRLDLGYPAGKDAPAPDTIIYTCRVSDPNKSFAVQQHPHTAKYFMLDVYPDPVAVTSLMRSFEFAVDAPYCVQGMPVEQFLRLAYVKVGSIVEEPGRKDLLRVEFSIKLDPGQAAARNWLLLDTANHMALVEYCVGNFPLTSRTELRYEDRGGDIPVVMEMKAYYHSDRGTPGSALELTQTNVVDKFDFHNPPDKVFTLAAFGIYERSGFQVRWYVWLFLASVLLLAFRAWFWRRHPAESSGR